MKLLQFCLSVLFLQADLVIAKEYIYVVSNLYPIYVVDLEKETVVKTIKGSGESLAVTPNGDAIYMNKRRDLYCVNTETEEISILCQNNEPFYPFLNDFPHSFFAVTPDQKFIYAILDDQSSICVIDIASGEIDKTISMQWPMEEIAFAPDKNVAYVVGGSTLSVIDLKSQEVTDTFPIGDNLAGIVVAPDGRFIYISDWGDDFIRAIDATTFEIVKEIELEGDLPGPIAISSDGNFVYVGIGADSYFIKGEVKIIDTKTFSIVNENQPLEVGNDPRRILFAADGTKAYVLSARDNKISVIDTKTHEISSIPVSTHPLDMVMVTAEDTKE